MTREELVTRRAAYMQAEIDILTGGQSYAVPGLSLTRAQLPQVQAELQKIDRQINEIDYGGGVVRASFGDRG